MAFPLAPAKETNEVPYGREMARTGYGVKARRQLRVWGDRAESEIGASHVYRLDR